MSMFGKLTETVCWESEFSTKARHRSALRQLISAERARQVSDAAPSQVPGYVLELWRHLLAQIKHVEIMWYVLRADQFACNDGAQHFGYKALSRLFCNDDCDRLDFRRFAEILPNLQTMSLFHGYPPYQSVVALDDAFITNVVETVDIINRSDSLSASFRAINIVKPKNDIAAFIEQRQSVFKQRGWLLKQQTFKHQSTPAFWKHCGTNLCIQKM